MREGIQRGCNESELCLLVIRGVFIPPILLKKHSLHVGTHVLLHTISRGRRKHSIVKKQMIRNLLTKCTIQTHDYCVITIFYQCFILWIWSHVEVIIVG